MTFALECPMVGVLFCFGMLAVAIFLGTLICLANRVNESAKFFGIFLSGPCLDARDDVDTEGVKLGNSLFDIIRGQPPSNHNVVGFSKLLGQRKSLFPIKGLARSSRCFAGPGIQEDPERSGN